MKQLWTAIWLMVTTRPASCRAIWTLTILGISCHHRRGFIMTCPAAAAVAVTTITTIAMTTTLTWTLAATLAFERAEQLTILKCANLKMEIIGEFGQTNWHLIQLGFHWPKRIVMGWDLQVNLFVQRSLIPSSMVRHNPHLVLIDRLFHFWNWNDSTEKTSGTLSGLTFRFGE